MLGRLLRGVRACGVGFFREERGVALTEYIMLLGLLVVGMLVAALAFGGTVGSAWEDLSVWVRDLVESMGRGSHMLEPL